jgi:CheY-like chemotaxis protein
LVSLEDVTELEEAKVELRRSKEAAERASSAKSEFLARMSHEIRTPMNAILGFTDVLLRGYAKDETQRQNYLNTIHSSGTHLLDLINDILDLSKIEAGRMDVEPVRCAPYPILSQIVAALRIKAMEKGITCELAAATAIPETIVTDPVRFRQVITNLVGNAIKFTDAGGVDVTVGLTTTGETPQLAIDVSDTGVGIAPEALGRIFEPFSQADTTITRQFGGTGLGLSISRRLVEALGGRITVKSEPGAGSVFTATFETGSLAGVPMVGPESLGEGPYAPESRSRSPLQLPAARILVVDDGEANRELLSVVLRRAGADVVTGENGRVAVELAKSQEFDAIVMDMQMPGMDGFTAARTLRELGTTKPIIALTADALDGSEQKCRAAGCSDFLTKPIDMDSLLSVLHRILGEDRTGRFASSDTMPEPVIDRPIRIGNQQKPPLFAEPGAVEPERKGNDAQGVNLVSGPAEVTSQGRPTSVVSSLPADDPEFRQIVAGWVVRLREQLDAMGLARERRDFGALSALAHWLKGSGETVGFAVFTEPAERLERYARAGQDEEVIRTLEIIVDLADRIELPDQESADVMAHC